MFMKDQGLCHQTVVEISNKSKGLVEASPRQLLARREFSSETLTMPALKDACHMEEEHVCGCVCD